jgi:predicted nucleic acid-binding protein
LFSVYISDSNSPDALAIIGAADLPLIATPFTELEVENAIHQRLFRRELTAAEVKAAIGSFRRDIADFVFDMKPFSAEMFRTALLISSRHTPSLGTRSLDVLHVAAAVILGTDEFITFDRNQAKLASAQGLVVRTKR